MKFFTALLLFALAGFGPAMAQEGVPPECRMIVKHVPDAGVAYQEGVDVKGKPVVPADLGAPAIDAGKTSVFVPLSLDLAKRMNGAGVAGMKMESTLGFLEITPSGAVKFNDQDVTGQIYAACDENAPETVDGQASKDAIKSGADNNLNEDTK